MSAICATKSILQTHLRAAFAPLSFLEQALRTMGNVDPILAPRNGDLE